MTAVLVILPFCSDDSIAGFVIGFVMYVFIVVVVVVAHPCYLLLRRCHHYIM